MTWKAQWIGWNEPMYRRSGRRPVFRHRFSLSAEPREATVAVCGLGCFALYLNGERVGDEFASPAWSVYRKSCYYRTYQIAEHLRVGPNRIDVYLAPGMYRVRSGGRYAKFERDAGPLMLILQGEVIQRDGELVRLATDRSWWVTGGPVGFCSVYGGEQWLNDALPPDSALQEARRSVKGAGARTWVEPAVLEGPGGELREQIQPPIRAHETLEPATVSDPFECVLADGTPTTGFLVDLGMNHSGTPTVEFSGATDGEIELWPGEQLEAGQVFQDGSGGPFFWSCRNHGTEIERYTPMFTSYGYRYLEVRGAQWSPAGAPNEPPAEATATQQPCVHSVTSAFLHADYPRIGHFACSNELLNRSYELIMTALRSNMWSVFTDCPHRERLGWLEQLHLMGHAILAGYDLTGGAAKIMRDMADAQLPNGMVPTSAPEYPIFVGGFREEPVWALAFVLFPWQYYLWSGDDSLLYEHYDPMKRCYAYFVSIADDDGIVRVGLGDWYDLGPQAPGPSQLTSPGVTQTAVLCEAAGVLERVASLRSAGGETTATHDLSFFASERERLARRFNEAFWDEENAWYDSGSQCAQAIAVVTGIATGVRKRAAMDHLVSDIRQRDYATSAGDVGHAYVIRALIEAHETDVAYRMLSRTDPPSYGHQLDLGLTALAEAWTPELGDPRIHNQSLNHFMLGHGMEWFYGGLAGLRPGVDAPGFARIDWRPQVPSDLEWVRVKHRLAAGELQLSWRRRAGTAVEFTAQLPSGVSGTLHTAGERLRLQPGDNTYVREIV